MAIAAILSYSSAQNGNHEVVVLPDGASTVSLAPKQESKPTTPVVPASSDSVAPPIASDPVVPVPHPGHLVTLNDLVARFKEDWGYLAPATRAKLDCHFKVAAHYLDFDRDVTGIRLADMRVLKSRLSDGRKPSSVNDIIFKALGALFKLALDDEIIDRSPLERLKHARRGETERQQPSWEQSQQIVDEIEKSASETALIVRFMRDFGVGQAEIKFLFGQHIDFAAQVIHFRRKKTGKPFDVPIFSHAKHFVERLKAEGRLQVDKPVAAWRNPRKALATACENLNLPTYEPRAFRRCFIVHCLEMSIDPRVVAKWQGHKDAKLIFSVYGKHIDAKYEQREAGKLDDNNHQQV
jgi:integrase